MGSTDNSLSPLRAGFARLAIKLAIIAAAVLAIHYVMEWATARAEAANSGKLMLGVLAGLLLAYALLIAVPFMPGIEIGISLLMLKGASIAPLVYLATVLGLLAAFAAGRCIPYKWIFGTLADLRMKRACELVERLAPMTREERLAHLTDRAPEWLKPMVGKGRYVLLGALFNLPGNAVIGGGGGIAFIAGFSRLFRPSVTALVVLIAVMPVPLAVWFLGKAPYMP